MKKICKKCYYWDRTLHPRHAYKCYGGDCPAKKRDDLQRKGPLRKKSYKVVLRKTNSGLLRKQLNWLYKQKECNEKEGVTNLLENILDQVEGVSKR